LKYSPSYGYSGYTKRRSGSEAREKGRSG